MHRIGFCHNLYIILNNSPAVSSSFSRFLMASAQIIKYFGRKTLHLFCCNSCLHSHLQCIWWVPTTFQPLLLMLGIQIWSKQANLLPLGNILFYTRHKDVLIYLFIYYFFFLGPYLWHMEVPRLGIKLELQLQAYATVTWVVSAAYTTACGNARSLTRWARPEIEPTS